MKITFLFFLLSLLTFSSSAQLGQLDEEPSGQNLFEDDFIYLQLRNNTSIETESIISARDQRLSAFPEIKTFFEKGEVLKMFQAFPILSRKSADISRIYRLELSSPLLKKSIIDQLNRLSYVSFAEKIPLYQTSVIPNDPSYADPTKRWHLDQINAENAWNLTTGCSSVKIAIVDDAVLLSHEDLIHKIYTNAGEIPNNQIDDDLNGYIDDVNGWDAADNDSDASPSANATSSFFTHGTHVAGLSAGASNNATGSASIGFNSTIVPIKTSSNASANPGILSSAMQGVEYAINLEVDIINMSWGSYAYSSANEIVFNYALAKGIICVAAAGNDGFSYTTYPARYNSVISVGATDQNDELAVFSNLSLDVDVFAPGVNVYSSLAGSNNDYGFFSGTSMSTPIVAGSIGLMLCNNPGLTPHDVKGCVSTSSTYIESDLATGFIIKRLNADTALLCNPPVTYSCTPSSCELIANGGFEVPSNSNINQYSGFGALQYLELCSWQPYLGTYDVFPRPVDNFDHYAMGYASGFYDERIASNVMSIVPGKEYTLEFDYAISTQTAAAQQNPIDSIVFQLLHNDYAWNNTDMDAVWPTIHLGAIPNPALDFSFSSIMDIFNGVVTPNQYFHHFQTTFTAPSDTNFRRLMIAPFADSSGNQEWLAIDNISVRPVVSVQATASNTTIQYGDCADLSGITSGSSIVWEPQSLFTDPYTLNQTMCLDNTTTFVLTSYDSTLACSSSDSITITVNGTPTYADVYEVACSQFTWGLNTITYGSTGNYTDTIPNVEGGDSIVTLHLTINPASNSNLTISSCGSYFWPQTNTTYTSNGTYFDTLSQPNVFGCDSIIQLTLVLNTIDNSVASLNSNLLFMANQSEAAYQWLDCSTNHSPISGEISQTFMPPAGGPYSVEITQGTCIDTSECILSSVGISELEDVQSIVMYPNPTFQDVTIELNSVDGTHIQLYDAQGRLIRSVFSENSMQFQLEVNEVPGYYFIHMTDQNGGFRKAKLLKL